MCGPSQAPCTGRAESTAFHKCIKVSFQRQKHTETAKSTRIQGGRGLTDRLEKPNQNKKINPMKAPRTIVQAGKVFGSCPARNIQKMG